MAVGRNLNRHRNISANVVIINNGSMKTAHTFPFALHTPILFGNVTETPPLPTHDVGLQVSYVRYVRVVLVTLLMTRVIVNE